MVQICALEGCEEPVAGNRPGQKFCCGAHRARNRELTLAARKLEAEGTGELAGVLSGATAQKGHGEAAATTTDTTPPHAGASSEAPLSGPRADETGPVSVDAVKTALMLAESTGRSTTDEAGFRDAGQDQGGDSGPVPQPRRPTPPLPAPGQGPVRRGGPGWWSSSGRRRGLVVLVAVLAVVLVVVGVVATTTLSGPTGSPPAAGPSPFGPPADSDQPPPPATSLDQPTVVGSFPTNGPPETVAVSPDGKSAYLTITGDHPALEILDVATGQVINDVPVPGPPYFVGVSPSGEDVYVTYYDRTQNQLVIGTMDTRLGQFDGAIPTGQRADQGGALTWLFGFAISPNDPHLLYVPNMNASVVSVLDPQKKQSVAEIPVPQSPHWVALTPDGRFAYVTNHMPGQVTVIDTAQNKAVASIPIGEGQSPHSIAVSPDGKLVEEVNYDGNSMTFIDPATNTATGTIPLPDGPQSIAFAPDGAHSYVVSGDDKTVSVISSRDHKVTGTVPGGNGASMIAVTPDGTKAVVANKENNNVMILNVGTAAH